MVSENDFVEVVSGATPKRANHLPKKGPLVTGTMCDATGKPIEENSSAYILMQEVDNGKISPLKTYHIDFCPTVSESESYKEAILKCETGEIVRGEWLPLYNPEVIKTNF